MSNLLVQQIIEQKRKGVSDKKIGEIYGVNYKFIEQVITKELGLNISSLNTTTKKIKKLQPKDFQLENSTVWSFKSRGNWATHNGNYRGNWSPYIPRNIILKYSNKNDTVLDYFCGSGTTAVECKLLNRSFIGVDINPNAIEWAKQNIDFDDADLLNGSKKNKLHLLVGDARDLSFIDNNAIDLICAHPPYADIINYTENNPLDLSHYSVEKFLTEIEKIANESYRVLKDNRHCAILIGDMRKNKNVIPLGCRTIQRFLNAGFKIKELIIKRQHNCKTAGFWYKNSIKYNFLLLAHEYLVVFKKVNDIIDGNIYNENLNFSDVNIYPDIELETTTVWIFNEKEWVSKTISNIIKRYSATNYYLFSQEPHKNIISGLDLTIGFYNKDFDEFLELSSKNLKKDGFMSIIIEDIRSPNGLTFSLVLEIVNILDKYKEFKIKEIIILSIEGNEDNNNDNKNLTITHKYLLIYKKVTK